MRTAQEVESNRPRAVDLGSGGAMRPARTRPTDGDGDGVGADDLGAIEGTLLFADGFESGFLFAWSAAVGAQGTTLDQDGVSPD